MASRCVPGRQPFPVPNLQCVGHYPLRHSLWLSMLLLAITLTVNWYYYYFIIIFLFIFYAQWCKMPKGWKQKLKTHVGIARGPARRRVRQKTRVWVPHWTVEVRHRCAETTIIIYLFIIFIYYYYYYYYYYFILFLFLGLPGKQPSKRTDRKRKYRVANTVIIIIRGLRNNFTLKIAIDWLISKLKRPSGKMFGCSVRNRSPFSVR